MKLFLGLMSAMLALGASASSGQNQHFSFDSSLSHVETILQGEKTHTEYRTRTYTTTCERTETTWRTICTNPPRYPAPPRHPGPGPGPGPRPRYLVEPSTHCETVPVYRTVIYSCQKTESVPYEVHDYNVEARISINIVNASEFKDAKGVITAHLYGDSVYLKASNSRNYFVMIKDVRMTSRIAGGVMYKDVDYEVELVKASPVLSALSFGNVKVVNNGLNFEVGKVADRDNLSFKLKIFQDKLIGNDPTLIDRELLDHEMEFTTVGNKTQVRVDFSRLNLNVRGGKFNITPSVEFKYKGKLLNDIDFPNLTASKTITFKAR